MSQFDSRGPKKGRPVPPPARAKPTPARDVNGGASPRAPQAEANQVELEVDGESWTVRVLGRSGRASRMSPSLLLLGFWRDLSEGDPPLEALVSGTTLASLSPVQLEAALSAAERPADVARRKAFFAEASQPRRR